QYGSALQLVRPTDPVQRVLRREPGDELRVVALRLLEGKRPRADAVGPDAMRGEEAREIAGELDDAGLSRAVARRVGEPVAVVQPVIGSDMAVHRGDGEDAAPPPLQQGHHRLHRAERSVQADLYV